MTITLTGTEQTKLTQLHGLAVLKRATNPEGTASAVDWDAAGTGVEACIAAFARNGYNFGQDNIEVLFYSILWMTPRVSWSPELKAMHQEFTDKYPQRFMTAASTGNASADDVDTRKAFTDDNLSDLDRIRSRPGHDQGRGNV